MKTLSIFRFVALAIICLSATAAWAVNGEDRKIVTVCDAPGTELTYRTSYEVGNDVEPYVRYHYDFDKKDRLKSVTLYRWNKVAQHWVPRFVSKYSYIKGKTYVQTFELDQDGDAIDKTKQDLSFTSF